MAHVLCDGVCDVTFHEVPNNFNNNIVMLNKTYNITNKSGKIEYTCFANVFFFVIDPVLISIYCTHIFMLLRSFSCRVNYTKYTTLHVGQYYRTKMKSVEEFEYS
jgi:hypothetical protein